MLSNPWIAAMIALFAWWFFTGVILVAVRVSDRMGARARRMAVLGAVPILALGVWGYSSSLDEATMPNVYIAFASALLIWGWIELAFLNGIITGPNLRECPDDLPEWERFIRAWGTIAYHEMLLVAVLILMAVYGHDSANPFGLWTFALLFAARISAKLNLYLGVPKINIEFLPSPLLHLASHFRIQQMNWLFPISVSVLTFAVACWLERMMGVTTPAETLGFALLAAMTALALLEHWFMVLPLPDEKLWHWMLPAPKHNKTTKAYTEDAHGLRQPVQRPARHP